MASRTQDTGHEKDQTLTLLNVTYVIFRILQPDDVPALQRFHERLSEKTIYLRFFGSLKEFPEEKAQYFSHVDGIDHFTLVALDPDDPDKIIALARYDREPSDERAEYAALVEDSWQGYGAGIALTHGLIGEVRDKGVQCFYALVMGENRRMLELLRHLGLPEQERREGGNVKHVEVELPSEGL